MLKGLDFDDVLIEPQPSTVNSRDDVDLSVKLSDDLTLKIPVIASPMKGIVSPELIIALGNLGGIGILHRFYQDAIELFKDIYEVKDKTENWGASIGLGSPSRGAILDAGAKIICIDVANGYTHDVLNFCESVKALITIKNSQCLLMAGNVATAIGAKNLQEAGVDLIRVGIGSGQLCTTRNITGVGIPQITAIQDCSEYIFTVADGGIRNSGDAVKAFVAGADLVMLGSLLATTFESSNNGLIYGMASRKLQEEYYQSVKSVEGMEKTTEKTQSLEDFISEFSYGIKSACTYVGARNLNELRQRARFIEAGSGSIKKSF